VVIVNATRDDLRDEFAMADEAFALSPISARATLPGEADYDAIREAFMETSRGRWFLGEYAKRNRNADTRMVLDAVARVEETIAAQKKPARDPALDEALAAIRAALDAARIAASAALGDLALAESLAPVRKGARVIREISWRLREIGADGRICDLIDSQVGAIEQASGKLATIDPAMALGAAFELIEGRIGVFDASEASVTAAEPVDKALRSSPQAPEDTSSSAAAGEEETAASPARVTNAEAAEGMAETVQAGTAAWEAEAANSDPAALVEAVEATVEAAEAIAEPVDAFDAQDEAVLDMIAAEMSVPDSDEAYAPPGMIIDDGEAAEWHEAEPIAVAEQTGPAAMPVQPAREVVAPSPQPSPQPSLEVSLEASLEASPIEPSLGSSLIASGIVQRPRATRPDPLAPIRRMSQSERIAFFS
jgi:hypothetical protein